MKNIIQAVKIALKIKLARYKVQAVMADSSVPMGYRVVTHYATSWNDAQEWMKCYPAGDECIVWEMFAGRTALIPVAWRLQSC